MRLHAVDNLNRGAAPRLLLRKNCAASVGFGFAGLGVGFGGACVRGVIVAVVLLSDAWRPGLVAAQSSEAARPAVAATLPATQPGASSSRAAPPPPPVDPDKLRAAVQGGLDWLAREQVAAGPDAGSWQGGHYPTAVTSLAGLAFLAHGHRPHEGRYAATLQRAMQYVQSSMTDEGYLGTRGNSMYVHAICTMFGVSYLGHSKDPAREVELAKWCRRAIGVIVEAQRVRKPAIEQGGWRYGPDSTESDLSVTSWQLLALLAARQCGYEIDQQVFDAGLRYINSAYQERGEAAGYLYRPGVTRDPEPGVTGTAIAIKTLLERSRDPKLDKAMAYLERTPPAWGGAAYKGFYYSVTFYVVQGYFQRGPEAWARFGPAVQRILIEHQSGRGHWPFPPDGELEAQATSPAYATAMALLILGMDNQYLPMYQRQHELFSGGR